MATCQKLLGKPAVPFSDKISDEERMNILRILKKLVDMRLRVRKIRRGSMEPLTPSEEFSMELPKQDTEEEDTEQEEETEDDEDLTADPNQPDILDAMDSGSFHESEYVLEACSAVGSYPPVFCKTINECKNLSVSEGHEKVKNCFKSLSYLVRDDNKFKRLRLSDVNPPQHGSGSAYERYCMSFTMSVPTQKWPDHVRSTFHQINFKIRLYLLGLCWNGDKQIPVHQLSTCKMCKIRIDNTKKYQDKDEDILYYQEGKDEELIEIKETLDTLQKMKEAEEN